MSLSRSSIDYLTHVWNPIVGCNNTCEWCWARNRWAPRQRHLCELCGKYVPHVHMERFGDVSPRQKPKVIGIGFFADLFGPWKWPCAGAELLSYDSGGVIAMLAFVVKWCPQHQFVTLTKFPENIPKDFDWPENWWIGVSCTTQAEAEKRVPLLLESGVPHAILSLEPLLGPVEDVVAPYLCFERDIEWVIVGGLTGCGKSPTKLCWLDRITTDCQCAYVPVFVKRNAPQDTNYSCWPTEAPEPIAAILGIEAEDT